MTGKDEGGGVRIGEGGQVRGQAQSKGRTWTTSQENRKTQRGKKEK